MSNIQSLITNRLEDLVNQIEYLYEEGRDYEADLLRVEGLELAQAYDDEYAFLYIRDLKTSRS